ncbi:bile acid:sodium symporter family protein [Sphingomonas echinoides]|uniref:bile acid:sodium symporter family protein n=1 Tax=Sphingomonas echinoides TaxID=59803 RepID=UPI0024138EB0|nr:bile acid:sodium symporter family protein [Sphingomonas echinoides]
MTRIRSLLGRLPIDPYMLLLIGTVVLAFVLPAHGVGQTIAEDSVLVAVGLLFFLYGARLSPAAVWAGITHWRLQSLVLASTFVMFPIIGLAAYWGTRGWLPEGIAIGLLYLCLLPSTVQSSIAFTSIARGNVPAALCSASVSNLLGVVVTPLLVAALLQSAGSGFSLHAIEGIALQILLPFIAGQVARPMIGTWLAAHQTLTSVIDRGSILLVVYTAFSAGVVAGVWTSLSSVDLAIVAVIAIVILAVILGITTGISRWLSFSTEDEIALVFCGSKKSMASGLPMATILFAGHSVSLIVLPLMLFHQIQLFVCAILARRYARRAIED